MTRWRKYIVFASVVWLAMLAIWFLGRNPHGDVWMKYRQISRGSVRK